MQNLKRLIFDADDTLWENNIFYIQTADSLFDLFEKAGWNRKKVSQHFDQLEIKVVKERGYGSENYIFILESIFDYYYNLNHKKLDRKQFNQIIKNFRNKAQNKPPVFTGVEHTLKKLSKNYDLYVLTKGNIEEQKRKVNDSNLGDYFVESFVVEEKDDQIYKSISKKYNWKAAECCMIGNSPKSDINPALRIGMFAIFIPYPHTWKLDNERVMKDHPNLYTVNSISEIPNLLMSYSR